jgi:hypothetical protein
MLRDHGRLRLSPALAVTAAAVLASAVLAGCGSTGSGGASTAGSASASGSADADAAVTPDASGSCPSSSAAATGALPSQPPAQLPHPAQLSDATMLSGQASGVQVLKFVTAMPLSAAAGFVQTHYAAAGYRITGGDAERDEADIQWAGHSLSGRTRLSATGPCTTTWLVATIQPGASPGTLFDSPGGGDPDQSSSSDPDASSPGSDG